MRYVSYIPGIGKKDLPRLTIEPMKDTDHLKTYLHLDLGDESEPEPIELDYFAIPLYEGMVFTIHGIEGEFRVKSWRFHWGHPDEQAGLHIELYRVGEPDLKVV